MKKINTILWGLGFVVIAVAMGYYGFFYHNPQTSLPAPTTGSGGPEMGKVLVKFETVQEADIRHSVLINGKLALNGTRIHQMSARVAGRVDRLNMVEGAKVQAGQPVAWLYSPEFIAAQNEFLLAMNTVRTLRQGSAGELQADAQATWDGARQRLMVLGATEADVAELERSGRVQPHLIVRSGISGSVIKRNVDPGGYLEVGGSLGTVADMSSLWFMGHVFDADLPLIRPGLEVAITVNGVDLAAPLLGKVSFISPTLDTDTRSVAIRVELNNVGEKLKPEMFARGEIHLGTRRLPVIPRAALVQDGAESFVMVRRGGSDDKPTYTRLAVQTVPANDPNQWAIVGGLAPGEQVVMEGSVLVERDYIQTQIIRGAASR